VNRTGPETDLFSSDRVHPLDRLQPDAWLLSLVAARARNRAPVDWLGQRLARAVPVVRGDQHPLVLRSLSDQLDRSPRQTVEKAVRRLAADHALTLELAGDRVVAVSLTKHAARHFVFRKWAALLLTDMRWGDRTVARLAGIAGVSRSTFNRWLVGEGRPPAVAEIVRLGHAVAPTDVRAYALRVRDAVLMALDTHEAMLTRAGLTPAEQRRARAWLAEALGPTVALISALYEGRQGGT
jgi:hypothetical protein